MTAVADGDPHEQISRLEAEVEALGESAERCRKIAFAAKVAIGAGAVLLAAILLGIVRIDAVALMSSTILIIGGIVVSGSNATTANQFAERIEAAEKLRAELIGRIDLRVVAEPEGRVLH